MAKILLDKNHDFRPRKTGQKRFFLMVCSHCQLSYFQSRLVEGYKVFQDPHDVRIQDCQAFDRPRRSIWAYLFKRSQPR